MALAAGLVLLPAIARAQDVEAGKTVFKRCSACHNAESDSNKIGPTLKGVVGRNAGSLPGFSFSQKMKEAGANGLVWNEAALAEFLASPKTKVPGNSMTFAGLRNSDDVKNVIAYLKSTSQ
ncbi:MULTISPECIES: cytochrome c family protein [unclassified Mesorhizobium]|uniref:c-type cytochrome n=1 Tax=unclassified Mesorhizobium TaxID=325217 RepID=UPI001FF05F06|nr:MULTISPECIES: cytochrome c family protein [unclassified Mesorhizobium]